MQTTDWRPTASLELLRKRARILQRIRAFFDVHHALEVDTPMLSQAGLTAPEIESFAVSQGADHAQHLQGYLHTSPEFPMKRLLAAGLGDIYQLCHVFRAEESGKRHNGEFMLLEWYRVGWTFAELMDEVAALIQHVFDYEAKASPDFSVTHLRYFDAIKQYTGIDAQHLSDGQLQTLAIDKLSSVLTLSQTQIAHYDRDDWLSMLLSVFVEPKLGLDGLCFLTHYPASQAALARLDSVDSSVALRFECFYQGVELANGFEELIDAREQRQRFEAENHQRECNGQSVMPIDMHLINALAYMPQTSGVALGVDRLIMLATGQSSLGDVMAFPIDRA